MTTKRIYAAAAAAFAVFMLAAPAAAKSKADDVRGGHSAEVDKVFAGFSQDTPGCAVAVDHRGKIVHLAGYGMADLEQGVPIRPDSVFYAGSVSKQVVGMAAMLLAHDGLIDLDAPVRTYLPNLPAYADEITVRQTLHHTSGVRDFFILFTLAGEADNYVITEDAIMAMLARQRGLNFEPGEKYAYSNSAYFLISQIAKAVTGADLDAFAQARIFAPLGMKDSRFQHNHRRLVMRKAHGYAPQDNGSFLAADSTLDVVGSGGMYTTVLDLVRWDRNFYDNKLGGGSALIEEMQTSAVLNSGDKTDYGVALGLKPYRGLARVAHAGALVGYRSFLARFPGEEFSVALLCNSSKALPGRYADAIADIFLAGKFQEPAPAAAGDDEDEAQAQFSPGALDDYAGAYFAAEVDNGVTIKQDGDQLKISGIAIDDPILQPQAQDVFRAGDGYFELVFRRGPDGSVAGFVVNSERASGVVFERDPAEPR